MEIIHHHFKSLSSTNDWGKEHVSTYNPHQITIISTDEQTEGRGQYGRRWIAPYGLNIYASFCFFINEAQRDPLSLTHLMALAAAKTLENYGIACRIKWPNDVMVEQKKIAGILCETIPFTDYFWVVIGIGFNVNMPSAFLKNIEQPATSILAETGQEENVSEVLRKLTTYFVQDLPLFLQEGFHPFLPHFRQLILPSSREL